MEINKLNEELSKISNDYYQQKDIESTKDKLNKQIQMTQELNEKINKFTQDPCVYVNNNNIDYSFKPESSTSSSYQTNNSSKVEYNEIYRRESRDEMNNRLNSFNFNNTLYENNTNKVNTIGSKSLSHPLYYNNPIATKNTKKLNKKDISNNRLSEYSPLGRAVNNNYMESNHTKPISSTGLTNYRSNYKELNNERLNNFSPLCKTLTLPNDGNKAKTEYIKTHQKSKQNFNDVNPKYANSIMTEFPVNSRIE